MPKTQTLTTTHRVAKPDVTAARRLAWDAYIASFQMPADADAAQDQFRALAAEILRLLGHPETVEHP